ncbi:MAG: recombinase family protein [Gluconobacter sp.]
MRVSTTKRDDRGEFVQVFDLQHDALMREGVQAENIFEDRASGTREDRSGLAALLDVVKDGDTILVWKLDRLGRSARHLLEVAETMKQKGFRIRSNDDGIFTGCNLGEFLLTILSAVAQLERKNISERVSAGIASSRTDGGRIGRKKALSPAARRDVVESTRAGVSVSELSRRYRVNRATIYRTLTAEQAAA